MHLKDVEIVDSFILTGRGKTLVTNLDFDAECHRFNMGDTLIYENKIYEIVAIEALLRVRKNERGDVIALVVKEITMKQLFSKVVSKEKSTWIKEAKWRQRNWWWLWPWKRIQIKWYCYIKPFFTKINNKNK